MKQLKIGVCAGRHEMPCTEFVFPKEINPLNVRALEYHAYESLQKIAKQNGLERSACVESPCHSVEYVVYLYDVEVRLYVTGLTVAVVAALKAAPALFASISLMHYDKNSNSYYEQVWK